MADLHSRRGSEKEYGQDSSRDQTEMAMVAEAAPVGDLCEVAGGAYLKDMARSPAPGVVPDEGDGVPTAVIGW